MPQGVNHSKSVSIFIDMEAVNNGFEPGKEDHLPLKLVTQVMEFAKGYGRILRAEAFGSDAFQSGELRKQGITFNTCFASKDTGTTSLPESVAIIIAACELLYKKPTETVVLVSDDTQLSELTKKLRTNGAYIVVVTPQDVLDIWNRMSLDEVLEYSTILDGNAQPNGNTEAKSRSSKKHDQPEVITEQNVERLILLVDDLEHKMPFVGIKWLKNKVLGQRTVGIASFGGKQVLLNRAVEEKVLETYKVANQVDGGEQVTACKLNQTNPRVSTVLAARPPAPEQQAQVG